MDAEYDKAGRGRSRAGKAHKQMNIEYKVNTEEVMIRDEEAKGRQLVRETSCNHSSTREKEVRRRRHIDQMTHKREMMMKTNWNKQ